MRSIALAKSCVLGLVVYAGTAAGQTTVQYGAAAAAAAVGTSKGAGGMLNGLDKALKSLTGPAAPKTGNASPAKPPTAAPKAAAQTTTAPTQPEKVAPPPPAPTFEDPSGIKVGLAYDELLRRFGPPSLEILTGPGTRSLDYSTKEGGIRVECLDGKVIAAGRS
jgi:hypothetical protein